MTVSLTKPAHLLTVAGHRARLATAHATGDTETVGWLSKMLATHRAHTVKLDHLIRLAEAHGWTAAWSAAGFRTGQALHLHRGDTEYLHLQVDPTVARYNLVGGTVATGPVSRRHFYRSDWVRTADIAAALSSPAPGEYADTEWVLVVGPGYVERRTYETACNYAEYRVAPGVYPVEITDGEGRPARAEVDGSHTNYAVYAVAVAPSVRFHEYYVNQMFGSSSVAESWEEEPAVTHIRIYSYQLRNEDRPRELPADLTGRAVYLRRADLPEGFTVG